MPYLHLLLPNNGFLRRRVLSSRDPCHWSLLAGAVLQLSKLRSRLNNGRRSASQSVLISGPLLGPFTRFALSFRIRKFLDSKLHIPFWREDRSVIWSTSLGALFHTLPSYTPWQCVHFMSLPASRREYGGGDLACIHTGRKLCKLQTSPTYSILTQRTQNPLFTFCYSIVA